MVMVMTGHGRFGRSLLVIMVMAAAAMVVIMMMLVRVFFVMIVAAAAVVVIMMVLVHVLLVMIVAAAPVGMRMPLTVGMGVTVVISRFVFVMVMVVVTRLAMGVVVRADSGGAVPVEEIESTEEEKADSGNEGIDPEAGVEVFLDPSARVEVEEQSAPDEQGQDREHLEELLHDRLAMGFRGGRVRGASKHNSARR